jgi:quercetin dioxygenase-like cupin family protein
MVKQQKIGDGTCKLVIQSVERALRPINPTVLTCQPARDGTTFPPMSKPIQVPSDGGKKINVLGIPMVIRVHGRDTDGVVSAVESHDVQGGGPPPHIHHREDETFQILEGEYEWTVGGKTFIAQKGSTIFAPRGIPHTYRYLGKTPGRLMCVITPSGFESFFEEIGALSPEQQQDIPRVIELGKKYGLEFPPPPGA